jgi:hypothetical protein
VASLVPRKTRSVFLLNLLALIFGTDKFSHGQPCISSNHNAAHHLFDVISDRSGKAWMCFIFMQH